MSSGGGEESSPSSETSAIGESSAGEALGIGALVLPKDFMMLDDSRFSVGAGFFSVVAEVIFLVASTALGASEALTVATAALGFMAAVTVSVMEGATKIGRRPVRRFARSLCMVPYCFQDSRRSSLANSVAILRLQSEIMRRF